MLSPTGETLVTEDYGKIQLWDTGLGQLKQTRFIGSGSRNLSFSSDGKHLQNSFGKLRIDTSISDQASDVHAELCWFFAFDCRWLTCNGRRILLLPDAYSEDNFDFYDNIIAIVTDSGVPILLTVELPVDPSTGAVSVSLGTLWT